jgi:peptidyl-prolyl cis-trans isomerase SurA
MVLALAWTSSARAQGEEVQRIAAVVNDQVISAYDLEGRVKLVVMSSALQDTPEIHARLQQQILRSLIDESLEIQEAKRLNISINANEIDTAVDRIAKQNNMSREQFENLLATNGVPLSALTNQIKAGLAWSKVINQKIRPTIEIGDDQIQEFLDRLKADENKPEFHLAEIFLAVDSPDQDDQVHKTAERLAEQLRSGANFPAIARQFSQSTTAAVGGDMGWVRPDALQPEVAKVLLSIKVGQLSDPIRTVAGYYLVALREERSSPINTDNVQFKLEHIFLPGPPDATPDKLGGLRSVADTVTETATSCADFTQIRKDLPDAQSVLPATVAAKDLSPELRKAALSLPDGKASQPIDINNGVLVLMVCSREGGGLPDPDDVRTRIGLEKLDLLARRYLRDLRVAAFIDLRA